MFRNYELPAGTHARFEGSSSFAGWQAARATSAAPLYFPALNLYGRQFQDGGLLANNPSAIGLHEARTLFPGRHIELVASFGTGKREPTVPPKPPMVPPWYLTMKTLVRAATRTEDVHQLLADTLPLCGTAYFRLNPPIDEKLSLDETSPNKLSKLQQVGRSSVDSGGCCATAMDELVAALHCTAALQRPSAAFSSGERPTEMGNRYSERKPRASEPSAGRPEPQPANATTTSANAGTPVGPRPPSLPHSASLDVNR